MVVVVVGGWLVFGWFLQMFLGMINTYFAVIYSFGRGGSAWLWQVDWFVVSGDTLDFRMEVSLFFFLPSSSPRVLLVCWFPDWLLFRYLWFLCVGYLFGGWGGWERGIYLLPNTGHQNNTTKQLIQKPVSILHVIFHRLLHKCCFVAWKGDLPRKLAWCFVIINSVLFNPFVCLGRIHY